MEGGCGATVDGRNPTPEAMENQCLLVFTGASHIIPRFLTPIHSIKPKLADLLVYFPGSRTLVTWDTNFSLGPPAVPFTPFFSGGGVSLLK